MTNSSNPTKDQHFVPRFYLKNFAAQDGCLEVLNIREKRIAKRRPYQGLGYAHYYYAAKTGVPDTISQQIEEWFNPMENFIAKELPRIIDIILSNQHIENDDCYILSALMSMLWLRTPGMRNQLKEMEEDMAAQIKKLHGIDGEKYADDFKSKDNISYLKFMVDSIGFGSPGFTNMFFNMKWKAYIARGKECFVTSDSPVVEKWLPPKGFYGASFLDRDKYFALTPQILLELTHPRGSTKLKRETLYDIHDDVVRSLNIIITSSAQESVYSGNKAAIEQLLAGCQNPGKLELAYIEKYAKPWAEHRARADQHYKSTNTILSSKG